MAAIGDNNNAGVIRSEDSPALKSRSGAYPIRFNDRVPKRLLMLETAIAKPLVSENETPLFAAYKNVQYPAFTNEAGNVFAIVPYPRQRLIPLHPKQFQVIEWFSESETANASKQPNE